MISPSFGRSSFLLKFCSFSWPFSSFVFRWFCGDFLTTCKRCMCLVRWMICYCEVCPSCKKYIIQIYLNSNILSFKNWKRFPPYIWISRLQCLDRISIDTLYILWQVESSSHTWLVKNSRFKKIDLIFSRSKFSHSPMITIENNGLEIFGRPKF